MVQNRSVDVIIPTYKPDERTLVLVRRLLSQTRPADKIWLIHTESGKFPEKLGEIIENEESIERINIRPEQFDHGGTRHFGSELSQAEILVYMTQDAVPADNRLLEKLIEKFEDKMVGAVYARQLPSSDCETIERFTRSFNYPEISRLKSKEDLPELGIKTYFCSNVCAAYRREIYEEMGGFERKTIFNEDMIMAGYMIQNGYKIAYAADAKVIHSHNYSAIQQLRRNFDLAVSQAEHPEIFGGIKSEGEGMRLVKETAGYLIRTGKVWLLFPLIWKSGFKYMGYRLGKCHRKLPKWLVLKLSMNPRYWSV